MKKPLGEKMEFFRQYDEVLFNQLEKKILDLETANQKLRILTKEYRTQFKNISDVVFMIGADFHISNISPSVEKLLGYKAEDFIGKPASDLRHIFTSESFERAITNISKMLKGEKIPATIYAFVAKDGTLKHIEIHGSPLIRDGQVAGTISVARDITERKLMEEKLRKSEEKYRELVKYAPAGIYEVDYETNRFVSVNDVLCEYSGYTRDELLTTNLFSLFTEESQKLMLARLEKLMANEKIPQIVEYCIRKKGGEELWIRLSARYIYESGKLKGAVGIVSNITAQKQAEEKLRESEANYRHLYNNSPAGIYRIDFKKGKFLKANDVFCEYLGCRQEEITSLNPHDMLTEESNKLFLERAGKMALGIEVPMAVEYEIFNKEGKRLYLQLNNKYIYDAEGYVVAADVVAHDITERRREEEKIHASLREKEILISEIHHRVKNNLQVISSLLGLQAKSSGNPELSEMLNDIQSRIRSMAMIHEKLYNTNDFNRIELSNYVKVLSQDLFNTHNINPRKIDLTIQTDGKVYVDVIKAIPCGLVLNELISNALKHAFPGNRKGKLQVTIRETKNAEIDIVVRDNGVGLPDNIDIHRPQTLGLELVNGLVKNQLDGQIEVKQNNGTKIRFKFLL